MRKNVCHDSDYHTYKNVELAYIKSENTVFLTSIADRLVEGFQLPVNAYCHSFHLFLEFLAEDLIQ